MDYDPFSYIEGLCRISASQELELNRLRFDPEGGGRGRGVGVSVGVVGGGGEIEIESELEVETESEEEAVVVEVEEVVMVSPPESEEEEEEEEYETPPERHSLTSSNEAKMGGGGDGDEEEEEVNGTGGEEEKEVDLGGDCSDVVRCAKRLKVDLGEGLDGAAPEGCGVEGLKMEIDEDLMEEEEDEVLVDGSVKVEEVVKDAKFEESGGCLGNGAGSEVDGIKCQVKNVEDGMESVACEAGGPCLPVNASVDFRKLPASFYVGGGGGRSGMGQGSIGVGTGRDAGGGIRSHIESTGAGSSKGVTISEGCNGLGIDVEDVAGTGIANAGISVRDGVGAGSTSQGVSGAESGERVGQQGKKAPSESSEQEMIQNLWNVLNFLVDQKKPF